MLGAPKTRLILHRTGRVCCNIFDLRERKTESQCDADISLALKAETAAAWIRPYFPPKPYVD
ncbi:hypothetical protein P4V33_00465, partial [Brevibacillus borstelensis]|nr:hypothetical protein [Brevibacillus borstelensis]